MPSSKKRNLASSAPLTVVLALIVAAPRAWADQTPSAGPSESASAVAFFEQKVRPILVNHCYACHSADTKPAGGLRVDDRRGLLEGGNTGPAVVPGDPASSQILARVIHKNSRRRMPLEGEPLTAQEVSDLTKWIEYGASWPAERVPASIGKPKQFYEALKKEHWAWQPLSDPQVPSIRDQTWPRDDVDRYLIAGLEAVNLRPVEDADRLTLIRQRRISPDRST